MTPRNEPAAPGEGGTAAADYAGGASCFQANTAGAAAQERGPAYTAIALVRLITGRKRGAFDWLVLRCPFCGKKHVHGAAQPGESPFDWIPARASRTRVSHCARPVCRGTYRLEQADSAADILVYEEWRP